MKINFNKEIDFEKYKKYNKYLNLLWIIPFLLVIVFANKNLKFLKMYYERYQKQKPEFVFSIFNKSMTNDTFFTIAIGNNILKNGNDNMDHLTWHENLKFPHSRSF